MAEVKWIKLYVDMFDNRKIKQIKCLPEGYAIIVVWVQLLCLAGQTNDDGKIYFTNEIPYTEQMMANEFGMPLATIQLALATLQQFDMVEIIDNILQISNWEKYQNVQGLEGIREYNRLAQQKHRSKLKSADVNDNVNDMSLTSQLPSSRCQGTDKDKEKEEDEDIEKRDSFVPQEERVRFKPNQLKDEFEVLWMNYPRKDGKKNAFLAYERARHQGATYDDVMSGIKRYVNKIEHEGTNPEYIAMGSTWFNQRRWEDECKVNESKKTSYQSNDSFNGYGDADDFFKLAMEAGLKGE